MLSDSMDPARGVYGISVAAELVGVPVQTLRLYETRGLLQPQRTAGGTRRYSGQDVDRASRINQLQDAGLTLAGISAVLELEARNAVLQEQIADLRRRLAGTETPGDEPP